MRPAIAFTMLGLLVSGCIGQSPALRKNPSFRDGYEDGCAAATNAGADFRERPTEDRQRYAADEAYRAGYANGLATCRRNDFDTRTAPGAGPITLPGPGH